MDVFKLKIDAQKFYPISLENLETHTLKKAPFYVREKEVPDYYAICPNCDNPIQIMNLYGNYEHTAKPFGKHLIKSVPGLAEYSQENYRTCIYANPHRLSKTDRRPNFSNIPHQILLNLSEQFDRAIVILREATGIGISNKFAIDLLRHYLAAEGFMYRGSTLINYAWMLAYMSGSHVLNNRYVNDESIRDAILESIPKAQFIDDQLKVEDWGCKIDFTFIKHRITNDEEYMQLVLSHNEQIIHRKKIPFDYQHLDRLTNKETYRGTYLEEAQLIIKLYLDNRQ